MPRNVRWRDVIMLLIPLCVVWVFLLYLTVLYSEVIHTYGYKMLMCLLTVKALGLTESAVPRAEPKVCRPIWSHQGSLVSFFTSVCPTLLFISLFLLLWAWMCLPVGITASLVTMLCQPLNSPLTLSLRVLSFWWGHCWYTCNPLYGASREADRTSASL